MTRLRIALVFLGMYMLAAPGYAEFINGDLTLAGHLNHRAAAGTTNT